MSKNNLLLPTTHPRYEEIAASTQPILEMIAEDPKRKVAIAIAPEVIIGMDNSKWARILSIAQHKKEWIEMLLLNCQFEFAKDAERTIFYKEGEWQRKRDIQSWLRNLGMTVPFTLYFLGTWEQRFASIVGTMLTDLESTMTSTERENVVEFGVTPEQQKLIDRRVGEASELFMHYCDGTGVNPKPAIEAILAEFQVWFDYSTVEKQFLKDLEGGFEFGINFFDQSRHN